MNYVKIRTYNEIVDFVHSRNNNETSPLIEPRSKNQLQCLHYAYTDKEEKNCGFVVNNNFHNILLFDFDSCATCAPSNRHRCFCGGCCSQPANKQNFVILLRTRMAYSVINVRFSPVEHARTPKHASTTTCYCLAPMWTMILTRQLKIGRKTGNNGPRHWLRTLESVPSGKEQNGDAKALDATECVNSKSQHEWDHSGCLR